MVDTVVVLEWLVDVGALLKSGDGLVRVETDKVDVEIPAPMSGALLEILTQAGQEVSTGTPICILET